MIIQAKLTIESKEYLLTDIQFEGYRLVDTRGFPTSNSHNGIIHLWMRTEDEPKTDFFHWSVTKDLRKNGFISFLSSEYEKVVRQLNFTDAFCVGYRNNFSSRSDKPMTTYLCLSARKIDMGGETHVNDWPVRSDFKTPDKPSEAEKKEVKPRIIESGFQDSNGKEIDQIDLIEDNTKVYFVIKSTNMSGKKITIDLSGNSKEFLYQGKELLNNKIENYTLRNSEERIELEIIS